MPDRRIERRATTEKQLEVGTWGVFFLWMGSALLASLPSGAWVLGVGVILLIAQLMRRLNSLRVERFWIVAGLLFMVGGASQLAHLAIDVAFIPLLCILAGAGLVAKALLHRTPHHA